MGATKGTRPKNAPRGRKRGVPNKITVAVKEAFQLAFEGIGGVDGLTDWACKNRGQFYRLYARLLPPMQPAGNTALVNINLPPAGSTLTPEAAYQLMVSTPAFDLSTVKLDMTPPAPLAIPATLRAPGPIEHIAPSVESDDEEEPSGAAPGPSETDAPSNVVSIWERLGQ